MSRELTGTIVRGVGGFYYVDTEQGVIECRGRGLFKKQNITPTVGDKCIISTREEDKGYITSIEPRKNIFIRPSVCNISQLVVVMAATSPPPNLLVVDKLLAYGALNDVDCLVCINKADLASTEALDELCHIYTLAGYMVVCTSVASNLGIDLLRQQLAGKISSLAGNSGVGKSSLLNAILGRSAMETGEVSQKGLGKHTTRHVELIRLEDKDSYLIDTPGFSSINTEIYGEGQKQSQNLFPELARFQEFCRFNGCLHIDEPDCAVKQGVEKGHISPQRYKNYILLLQELGKKGG